MVKVNKGNLLAIAVALPIGSLLAWSMGRVLFAVPAYVTAIFVWPVACTLVYGLLSLAREHITESRLPASDNALDENTSQVSRPRRGISKWLTNPP